MTDKELDLILESMKEEAAAADSAQAQARVWQKLNPCGQFREQFAAFREGSLSEAKQMLLDDHLSRCPDCRRVFRESEKPKDTVIEMPAQRRRSFQIPRWAIAAGVAAVAIFAARERLDVWMAPSGPRATVKQIHGSLYDAGAKPLAAEATLGEAQLIRTGGGAKALIELADGSLMEVNERTELFVNAAWSGQTVHLHRGDVIVHAAKQRRGSLRVITRDAEASVKGTIFTVSAGTAGSLVGVVEGSVAVKQAGGERLLKPGERTVTSPALEQVSVRDAVQWSSEREKYLAVLGELAAIQKQIAPATARTQARLVSLLPDATQFYAAIPNLGPSIDQAVGLIEERSRQVEVMREWWTSERSTEMRKIVTEIRSLSAMLGDEIVFLLAKPEIPATLAEVKPGQEAALQAKLAELIPAEANRKVAYRIVNGTLVVSQGETKLNLILARLGKGAGSPFANEIGRRYARGVAWIFGADLETIPHPQDDKLKFFGADNARFVFVEQRTVNGAEENEGSLIFAGARKGVASWIAAPGSSGSAEYVTSDAVAAFSAATRNPKQIFDEVRAMFGSEILQDVESRVGMNVTADLAASLGTDFTLAVETPSVPIPGWILAYEAYSPGQIDATFKRLADMYNASLKSEESGRKLIFKSETENGREWRSLAIGTELLALHWTFDRGYWLLGMDRGTLVRAIQTRDGGFALIRSEAFRAQTPALTGAHSSGFLWLNLSSASQIPGVNQYVNVREPSLVTFTGEAERIQAASRTRIAGVLLDVLMNAGANPKAARKAKLKKQV